MQHPETQDLEQTRISVLARARKGDYVDFASIYVPLVYRLARRLALDENTACDIAQESLLDLVQQMPNFEYDPTKQFRHFVGRIVYRKKVDYLRKHREESLEGVAEQRGVLPEEVEELSDGNASQQISDELLDRELHWAYLEAAFDQVRREVHSTTFRAFHLVFVEGKTVEEAARILGQTPNLVSQHKRRVLMKLRAKRDKLLERFGDDAT